MRAKWFVKVDSYWQGYIQLFFGPFESKQAAQEAADRGGAGHANLGLSYRDIRYQAHICGIYNTGTARRQGMCRGNIVPATVAIPGTTDGLRDIFDSYAWVD